MCRLFTKKGSRQDKINYRPISLLHTIGKVLERLVFNRMYSFLTANNLLTWRNSGYKKNDSTINRLIHIVNKIYENLEHKQDTCLVFLDQSKAFDRIHHDSLKYKMKCKGIDGNLLKLMDSYLKDRKLRVVLDGAKSSWFNIFAGVPQGSILGPLLFLIYADDIVAELECDIHLYADDAVLITNYNNPVTAVDKVNRDLDRLHTWAETWYMAFNPTKTKYMVISNTDRPHPSLNLNGVELDKVSSYPQLGLVLNEKMNWEDHINSAITKANKKMGLMWKLSNDLPRFAIENIYTSYIRPQLEYGSVIYHNCTRDQAQRLEACQRRAAIACTRAYRRTSTVALMQELGWPKLEDRRIYSSQVLIYKIANGFAPAYLQSLLPPRQGHHSNYFSRREHSFISVRANTNKLYNSFIPASVRKWNSLDTTLKSSRTIGSFKIALRQSMFIKSVGYFSRSKGKAAVAHTRIRLGLSPLRYQLFSYGIVPTPTCQMCQTGNDETPSHYFLKCPKYAASRQGLLLQLTPIADRLNINTNNTLMLLKLITGRHPTLSFKDNLNVVNLVQEYIFSTKRF